MALPESHTLGRGVAAGVDASGSPAEVGVGAGATGDDAAVADGVTVASGRGVGPVSVPEGTCASVAALLPDPPPLHPVAKIAKKATAIKAVSSLAIFNQQSIRAAGNALTSNSKPDKTSIKKPKGKRHQPHQIRCSCFEGLMWERAAPFSGVGVFACLVRLLNSCAPIIAECAAMNQYAMRLVADVGTASSNVLRKLRKKDRDAYCRDFLNASLVACAGA
jgi:hypothetical protein